MLINKTLIIILSKVSLINSKINNIKYTKNLRLIIII